MFYEVTNPSDPISLETDDDMVAAIAGLFLGEGLYGVTKDDGTRVLPILAFGGEEALEGWKREKGVDIDDFLKTRVLDVAECLESVMVARPAERAAIMAAIGLADRESRRAAVARYNESKRSSMNNIAKSALRLAAQFRGTAAARALAEVQAK